MDFWDFLGINPTNDKGLIKKAYAKKLKIYHPEDDPEGFQKLREAYDNALKYADDMQEREEQVVITDDSSLEVIQTYPRVERLNDSNHKASDDDMLSDFFNQLYTLYDDFFSRIDTEKWETLLNSKIVWNAGYREILMNKLMEFLMDHYYLPKNIWQLLERNFDWRNQQDFLYDHYPEQFVKYIFRQLEQTWELGYSFFKKVEGINYDEFLRNRENAFYALIANDLEQAANDIKAAYAIYTDDPDLLRLQGEYYKRIGDLNQALKAFTNVIQITPDDLDCHFSRAQILYDMGQQLSAIESCEDILSRRPDNLDVLCLLGKCYFKLGDMENAKKLFSQVQKLSPFDIDGITYLAQINAHLSSELIKHKSKAKSQELKQIYKELRKPTFIQSIKAFLNIWMRRTWLYLLVFTILQVMLFSTLYQETGLIPIEVIKEVKTRIAYETGIKKPTIIKISHGIYRVAHQQDRMSINLSPVTLSDLVNNNQMNDPIFGPTNKYACIGKLKNKEVIFLVNRELAMQAYKNKSITFEGSVYNINRPKQFGMSYPREYNTAYSFRNKFYANQYIGISSNKITKEVLEGITSMLLIIVFVCVLIINEARKTYYSVRFRIGGEE